MEAGSEATEQQYPLPSMSSRGVQ